MPENIDEKFEAEVEGLKGYRGNVSRLRREITKVSTLTEPACKILYRHLNGEECGDKLLENAKWVLTTLQTLYDTAIREESVKGKKSPSRSKPAKSSPAEKPEPESQDGEEEEETKVEENKPRLSMTYTPDRSTINESEKVDGADTEF